MSDFNKIGREVRDIFTASPVKPETEEERMVADLRYPGWREKGTPPLVPTPEAVEKWGEWWWYEGDIVEVFECSGATPGWGRLLATRSGDEREYYVNGMDGEWAGPVLERPGKREG